MHTMDNHLQKQPNRTPTKLDKANDSETEEVRRKVVRIKQAYIRKYGLPKNASAFRLDGIAPEYAY